jgi:SSS family solute:Na+ symporter
MDFYKRWRPSAPESQLVAVGRVATVIMVALGLAWIPFMSRISDQLYVYLQSVQAYISPPIAAVFLLGVFWKRINGQGAISALLVGFALGAIRFILEVTFPKAVGLDGLAASFVGMNFLHFAILMFVACVIVLVGVSLVTPAPERRKVAGLTFQTVNEKIDLSEVESASVLEAPAEEETPRDRTVNRALAVLLIAVMIMLWVYFA